MSTPTTFVFMQNLKNKKTIMWIPTSYQEIRVTYFVYCIYPKHLDSSVSYHTCFKI